MYFNYFTINKEYLVNFAIHTLLIVVPKRESGEYITLLHLSKLQPKFIIIYYYVFIINNYHCFYDLILKLLYHVYDYLIFNMQVTFKLETSSL